MNSQLQAHVLPGFSDEKKLADFLANIHHDTFVVAFYINNINNSQDEWMNPLAEYLKGKGYIVLGIISRKAAGKCQLNSADIVACVEDDVIRQLGRINVFIIIDTDFRTKFPQTSRVLGCIHGLTCADGNFSPYSMVYQLHNLGALDGWLASFPLDSRTREITSKLWTGFSSPTHCSRKNRHFHIIPMGYPRLAVISSQLAKLPCHPSDSIIYAPLGIRFQLDNGGQRLEKFGIHTISTLLDSFPEKNVVFRPYKTDIDSEIVKKIIDKFASHPRFVFDGSPERLNAFAHGSVLVTDLSHIGRSFSFSTLRPSIYFQPWKKCFPVQDKSDYLAAYTYSELIRIIRYCIDTGDDIKIDIKNKRDNIIIPPESSFAGIANCLKDFYEDKGRTEWLTISRNEPGRIKDEYELVLLMEEIPFRQRACFAAAAVSFNNPESFLLCACALNYGLQCFPKNYLYYDLEKTAMKLLSRKDSIPNYSSINSDEIEYLYGMALNKCLATNDLQKVQLVEGLLEKLRFFLKK